MTAWRPDTGISRGTAMVVLAGVLLVGGALRWSAIRADGLWMDEVFSASYVNLSLWEIVVAVLRFDIHPPGYYLQLAVWSHLGQSDTWLRLNSIVWSLGTVVAIYAGTAARAGRVAGLTAAALATLLGSELFFASELRMYTMLTCTAVMLWWGVDEWLLRGRRRALWVVGGLMLLLSLLHSTAFLAAGSVLCYAGLRWWQLGDSRPSAKPLVWLSVWTGLVLLPWLLNASVRSVSHTQMPGLGVIADTLGGWWLGYFPGLPEAVSAVAAVFTLVLLVLLLARGTPEVRSITLAFVVGPIVLVALISVLLRPIWLDRTMGYAAVFLPIAIALQLSSHFSAARGAWAWGAALVALQAMAFFGPGAGHSRLEEPRKAQYREAAQHIARVNTQSLPVYVPSNVRFWAIARYLVGPQWGSLLAVQDAQRVDNSDTWPRVYARLGDDTLARLHLKPSTRVLQSSHGTLWIGLSPLPEEVARSGYYFVGDMHDRERQQACPAGVEVSRTAFVGLMVFQCRQP